MEGFLAEGTIEQCSREKVQDLCVQQPPWDGVQAEGEGGQEDIEDAERWKERLFRVTVCNHLCSHQVTKSGLCLTHNGESLKVYELGQEYVCVHACA